MKSLSSVWFHVRPLVTQSPNFAAKNRPALGCAPSRSWVVKERSCTESPALICLPLRGGGEGLDLVLVWGGRLGRTYGAYPHFRGEAASLYGLRAFLIACKLMAWRVEPWMQGLGIVSAWHNPDPANPTCLPPLKQG